MSFAFNYMGAGLTAWSYHAVNLALHALVTWLLYLLALQLGFSFRAGLVGAVLFALHPIHTEAVSGIVGRSELLMAAGVLASLRWGIQGRLVLSLTAFLLALLSKEQAVMLPVLLLLFDLLFGTDRRGSHGRDRGGRHVLARYGPYALVLLGYVFLRWWALGTLKGPPAPFLDNPLPHLDVWPRLLTTIKVAGTYLWLCLWPVRLSGDYSFHAIPFSDSPMDDGVLFGFLTWGGMLAFAVLKYRTFPGASFAVGFLMLTFLPVSNLLMPIGTIMGERLFYLPSAGLCLLVGAGYDAFDYWTRTHGSGRPALRRWLHVTRAIGLGLLIGVCLLFLLRTILRNQDWVDDDHIAQSTLQAVPNSAKAHSAVGRLAKDKQQWDEAISHFQKALSIYPAYTEIDVTLNSNLGISLIEKGLVAEGTAAIERAVALDPSWSLLWYNLGFAYSKQSLNREAEAAYHQAARLNDEDPMAYTGLGFLFLKEHRYEDAPRRPKRLSIAIRPTWKPDRQGQGSGRVGGHRAKGVYAGAEGMLSLASPSPTLFDRLPIVPYNDLSLRNTYR